MLFHFMTNRSQIHSRRTSFNVVQCCEIDFPKPHFVRCDSIHGFIHFWYIPLFFSDRFILIAVAANKKNNLLAIVMQLNISQRAVERMRQFSVTHHRTYTIWSVKYRQLVRLCKYSAWYRSVWARAHPLPQTLHPIKLNLKWNSVKFWNLADSRA